MLDGGIVIINLYITVSGSPFRNLNRIFTLFSSSWRKISRIAKDRTGNEKKAASTNIQHFLSLIKLQQFH